ncbi:MAG: ComEA family DNA-binding protein [Candidatus Levybacteria bacterium]|nr:ComEA family DNA-binding protein [Candidatus Levybacteria bacterium]
MDFHSLFEQCKPLLKKYWLPLSLGFLGMIFFVYGLIGIFLETRTSSDNIVFEANSQKESPQLEAVFVDVEGAVAKPGLYKLPGGSRIQDGLVAAGGLIASADREFITKNLNLAVKLTDGAKVYLPFIGEASKQNSESNSSLVNVNSGSQTQLEALPGIGPATAQKIISGRPYQSVDELFNKKIVGSKVFEQIKDKITVY